MPDRTTLAKYWAQRWESGEHKPGDRYRRHLCAILALPHEIFDDESTPVPPVHYAYAGQLRSLGGGSLPGGEELIMNAARESAEYGRRHGTSNVHPVTIEQLQSDVRDLATDFVSSHPVPVVLRARASRDQTFELLDGRQWPRQTKALHSVAGRLCGLLAVASSDFFARYDAATTQCRTAWLCAEMSDDTELRAWIRCLQSGISMWMGRWTESADLARQAHQYSTTATSAMRAAALEARALARTSDADGVRRAIRASEEAQALPASAEATGVMDFSEANRLRCAGTAYLWLGVEDAALRYLEEALSSYERDDPEAYAFVAVVRADLTLARLRSGDVDGAAEAFQPLFALTGERRVAGLIRRLTDLRSQLATTRFRGSAVAADLADKIERFRTDMASVSVGDT